MIDVTAPLRHDSGLVEFIATAPHGNHRVVTALGPAAHIHHNQVTGLDRAVTTGHFPHLEQSVSRPHEVYPLFGLTPLQARALDIAHQQGLRHTLPFQAVQVFMLKWVAACCSKGLARATGIFGHHQLVGAVFTALVVIPVDLFEREAVLPQLALILVQILPQGGRVVHVEGINVDLMPWHKHLHLVAALHLRPEPLVMEIAAHAIGTGLEHNDRLGLEHNTAAHATHQVIRVVHRALMPECHFAQVGHRDVIAAHRILAAGASRDDQALALLNLLHIGLTLELSESWHFLFIIEEFAWIMPQHQVIHALDAFTRVKPVAADEAIPALVTHQLHPCQVHLNQGGAAPLTGLEQDHAHGTSLDPLSFHHSQQAPLRPVENEPRVAATHLVLDGHATRAPELKVLDDAQLILAYRV